MQISLSAFAPENLVSRDEIGSPVPRQPAHLHTQAESGAYLRDSSRVPHLRPFIHCKPPYAIGSVPSLSGHAIAYRWRSLPRVRRHRASKPKGNSERVLPWQVTMDQLICAFLFHTASCFSELVIFRNLYRIFLASVGTFSGFLLFYFIFLYLVLGSLVTTEIRFSLP